jgi:hypothetical protein
MFADIDQGSSQLMHSLSFHRIALVALALGTAGLTAASAQTPPSDGTDGSSTTPSATPSWKHHFHHHGDSVLTADEKAELKQDFQNALANADIKTAADNLKAQEKGVHEQAKALHEQIHAAIIAADPSAQAIFAKLEAAHQGKGDWHHHHHDDQSTDTSATTDSNGQ